MLPDIGPHRAAMLLAERQKIGRLQGSEELLATPEIVPAKLQRLLPLVSIE
ncbi:MAG: helix-hairpin-helix domain-containing protein [Desulfobulbus sp.]|nr:helix-hairpin-helix domain-containing protein [Desulfobulbus sp.]